jgi:ABC-type multidrug transport system fused ATPase/permease subunit
MPAIPIFDICAMLPLLRRGASKPLKVVDLPPPPSTFKLSNDGFPSQIEGLAKKLQSRSKPSRFPLVIQCVLAERFGLVLAGGLFGIVHGLVNSCGRFMIIRAAIDAVVSRSPMAERTPIAVVLVLIMFSEMLLFIVSKHIVLDHLAHYISGRMSSLVLIKITRMGTRPHGVEETTFVSADMTQLIFNTRFTCYLPTGLAGIFGGVAVLIIYLGVSGLVGLATLVICFQANLRISRRSKNADKVVQSRLKERLRTMKQTVDGIKALKFYGWEEKYCELLNELRDREVKSFTHFRRLQIFGVVLGTCTHAPLPTVSSPSSTDAVLPIVSISFPPIGRATPILATFTVFLAHTIQGVDLTSSEAFATVAVFQTLRVGMCVGAMHSSPVSS